MSYWDVKSTRLYEFGIYNPLLTKKQRMELEKMKKKVEKTIKIEDGKHEGKIFDVEEREEPYEYIDVVIEEKETKLKLKCGVPFHITENSALGILLMNFGAELKEGEEIEIKDYLKENTEVQFMTITEKTDKSNFVKILPQSLKPKK